MTRNLKENIEAIDAGIRCPSWRIVLSGLGCFGVVVLCADLFFMRGYFALVPKKAMLLGSHDYNTSIKYELASERIGTKRRADVYLIGGSTFREAISDLEILEKDLSQALGEPQRVSFLGSTGLCFAESLAIVDNLPVGPGVIVQAVMFSKFDDSLLGYKKRLRYVRVPFPSKALDSFLKNEKAKFDSRSFIRGWWFDYLKQYFQLYGRQLIRGRLPNQKLHWHIDKENFAKDWLLTNWQSKKNTKVSRFLKFHSLNFRALSLFLEVARRKHYSVVLLEMPMSPQAKQVFKDVQILYEPKLRRFAHQMQVKYWDFPLKLELTNSDFLDGSHLLAPGRQRFQAGLEMKLLSLRQPEKRQTYFEPI